MPSKLTAVFDNVRSFFTGRVDDDIIKGGIGNDELDGGAGDDTLAGFMGHDTLDGGDGDESKLTPAEARELLEASRDQEKPLIFSPDPNQLTNQRMPEIRRRKNW